MSRCILITFGLTFLLTGSGCKLGEVPSPEQISSAITFERNFGTTTENEAALQAFQLSSGEYVIFGYGAEEIIKLSKTGQKIHALASSRWVEGGFISSDDKIIFSGFDDFLGAGYGIVTRLDSNLNVEKEIKTSSAPLYQFMWIYDVKPAQDGSLKVMGVNNHIPFVGTMPGNFSAAPTLVKSYPEYTGSTYKSLFVDRNNFQWFSSSKNSQPYIISYTTTLDEPLPLLPFKITGTQNGELLIAGKALTSELPYLMVRKSGSVVVEKALGTRKGEFRDIEEVSDGFVAVGTVQFGKNGGSDLLLVKFSKDFSNIIWERDYGGAKEDAGWSITATKDGGFLVVGGTFSFGSSGDFYVVKTNSKGEIKR